MGCAATTRPPISTPRVSAALCPSFCRNTRSRPCWRRREPGPAARGRGCCASSSCCMRRGYGSPSWSRCRMRRRCAIPVSCWCGARADANGWCRWASRRAGRLPIPCQPQPVSDRRPAVALAVPLAWRHRPFDPAALRPAVERVGGARRPRPGAAVATCAAACLCQPPSGPRRRSAQRSADARACRHRDDPDLHPCPVRAAAPARAHRPSPRPAQMTRHFLDFERAIGELEGKIEELRHLSTTSEINITEEVGRLEATAARLLRQTYARLTPWQKVQVARHPERPHTLDYIANLITDFTPLAGDRVFAEDKAIVGGLGRFRGRSIMVLGTEKGGDTESRLVRNFGMARPEGYRKASRLMRLADRFRLPVLTFIDTAGAYPGVDAEARGQAEAIARAIETCLDIEVPLVAAVIGEGGSGGAIALAAGNAVLMLEHAVYSVISPEGCASILWRDAGHAQEAAEALRLTANDLLRLGVIDRIVAEPLGGAHRSPKAAIDALGAAIDDVLQGLVGTDGAQLRAQRREKFLAMGGRGL